MMESWRRPCVFAELEGTQRHTKPVHYVASVGVWLCGGCLQAVVEEFGEGISPWDLVGTPDISDPDGRVGAD